MPPRFARCLALALFALSSSLARAQSAAPSAEQPANEQRAVVVLVGAAGRDTELSALLRELLASRGVEAQLSTRAGFEARELLQNTAPSDAVHVFIVPGQGGSVRLYFRAPDGERFLLRSVLLRSGFDELGREQLGQIVETAVASLLHSKDGLTRDEAQAVLATEGTAPEPSPANAPVGPPARPALVPQHPPTGGAAATSALESWLALRYGATELGAPLGLAHGPGLELGLGVAPRRLLLRGRVLAERDFQQTLATALVEAQVDTLRLRLLADVGLSLTEQQRVLVSLGVGQDRSQVKPLAANGSRVAPAPPFQDLAPVAHAELRYELEIGRRWLRMAVAVGADAALVDTHYDVAQPGTRLPVVEPWLLRPTASLALAFCPVWTTF